MQALIIIGALVSLLGICGIVWCIILVRRARKANLADELMRAEMQRVVTLNMGALGVSVLGLMLVVAGIFLA